MRNFNIFMTGFASVFIGIAGCLVMLAEAVDQSFMNRPVRPPERTGIDWFDGFKKDRDSLALDWGKIGGDFRRAIDQYVETHEGKTDPII